MDRVYVIICDTEYYDDYETTDICSDAGFFTDKQDCLDAAEKMAKEELSEHDNDDDSASFGFVPERDEFYVVDVFGKTVSFRCECIEAHKKEED